MSQRVSLIRSRILRPALPELGFPILLEEDRSDQMVHRASCRMPARSARPCASTSLLIRLKPDASRPPCCSGCGQSKFLIHDTSRSRVRERDLLQYRVWLDVPVRRVRCPICGPRRERIDWLAGRQPLTRAMVAWVETLVRLLPIKHVANLVGLHWHTVKAIDFGRLQRDVAPPDLSRVRRLIMDEFALYKRASLCNGSDLRRHPAGALDR